MKFFCLFFLILIVINVQGQSKQDYVWVFGSDSSSLQTDYGYKFDFSKKPFKPFLENIGIGIGKTNTSISDKQGNLLFYSNGCAILNNEGQIMANGDSINYDEWVEVWNKDCSRGYPGIQDIIILADPGVTNEYYIIHKPIIFNGLNIKDSLPIHYSKVDMELDDGKGDVTLKNIPLSTSKNTLRSYLSAISHSNGKDWWLIQPMENDSTFWIYLIDEKGITQYPNQNTHYYFNRARSSATGTARFSPDGTKYALYNYYDGLHVFNFDRENGTLKNHRHITIFADIDVNQIRFNSLEWSPNSRFIYTASQLELHQIDLWEEDVQEDGVRLIDTFNGTVDPFATTFYLMAQGPDCKIYMCPNSSSNTYHVINKPDELADGCEFVQNGLKLPQTSNFGSMPNFPRFRVDEEEKCDSSIVSFLGNQVIYRKDMIVYPNPSNGTFHVKLPESVNIGRLVIFNLDGDMVFEQTIYNSGRILNIDLSNFSSGVYNIDLYPEKENKYYFGEQIIKVD